MGVRVRVCVCAYTFTAPVCLYTSIPYVWPGVTNTCTPHIGRTSDTCARYAKDAASRGIKCIIAGTPTHPTPPHSR